MGAKLRIMEEKEKKSKEKKFQLLKKSKNILVVRGLIYSASNQRLEFETRGICIPMEPWSTGAVTKKDELETDGVERGPLA